jgi:hypothetical protein
MDWRCELSSRVAALQVGSSELKSQPHQKDKKIAHMNNKTKKNKSKQKQQQKNIDILFDLQISLS